MHCYCFDSYNYGFNHIKMIYYVYINTLEEVMLLAVIQANSYLYMTVDDITHPIASKIIFLLPLFFFSTVFIRKVCYSCSKKKH